GPDLDRLVDSPTRRQELAAPAPSDLSHGNPRRGALLLAGKVRPPQAHRGRHRARPPAPLPGRSLVFRKSLRKEQAARPPSPRPESPVETGLAPSLYAFGAPASRTANVRAIQRWIRIR